MTSRLSIQPEDYDFQKHDPPDKITGYRPDRKQKSGLETLPTNIDYGYNGKKKSPLNLVSPADLIRRNLEALRYAKSKGYDLPPEASDPKFLTALLLKEDRPDFGTNQFDSNNEAAVNAFNTVGQRFGATPAKFVSAMIANNAIAQKTGVPFTTVWNGRGSNGLEEKGAYTKTFGTFLEAAGHPKNNLLYNFVDQHLNGDDYTAPLPNHLVNKINDTYRRRQYEVTQKALDNYGPMTELRHKLFGNMPILGVSPENDYRLTDNSIAAPNFDELTKQSEPKYKRGGAIERTTYDRKIL